MDTRVLIEVTVFHGESHQSYPIYGGPKGVCDANIVPLESYGDLLAQLVERAHDKYCEALNDAMPIDEDE